MFFLEFVRRSPDYTVQASSSVVGGIHLLRDLAQGVLDIEDLSA